MIDISFRNVSLAYGEKNILQGFTATFKGGEITAVTGKNGSGKSTLLKLAAQLIVPDSGSVVALRDGAALKRDEYRRHIAMVTPEMRLYPNFTAAENLRFFLSLRKIVLSDGEMADFFSRVGLPVGLGTANVGNFSTGMVQRLKIALLLAADALVTDYSSVCFDAFAYGKPIIPTI